MWSDPICGVPGPSEGAQASRQRGQGRPAQTEAHGIYRQVKVAANTHC